MTTKLKVETYLEVEAALQDKVSSIISEVLEPLREDIFSFVELGKYGDAYNLIDSFDFVQKFKDYKSSFWVYTVASLNFGAATATGDLDIVLLPKQIMENVIPTVVSSLMANLAKKAKEGCLDAITILAEEFKAQTEEKVSITKADKAERIVRDFQSFDTNANLKAMVISQLHTSRLSAYGFTSQAEVLGVEMYQLNEQLDNRACPVCKIMHKKIFTVKEARQSLDILLFVQDADEIKALQTWPKQNKESIEQLKSLTPQELVLRNWHIPPFHPSCRGLLYPVGEVPDLAEEEVFNYTATLEDFRELGIDVDLQDVENWNATLNTHPVDVISTVTLTDNITVLNTGSKSKLFDETPLNYLVIDSDFVKVGASGYFGGKTLTDIEVIINNSGVGTLSYLDTESPTALRNILVSLIGKGQSIGINRLVISAEPDTSYVLAKLGFTPSDLDWSVISTVMAKKLTDIAADLPTDLSSLVLKLLSSTSAKKANLIAEISYPYKGTTLGQYLLSGFYWSGGLDLSNVVDKTKALSLLTK